MLCQLQLCNEERKAKCQRLHSASWSDPSKDFYHDCAICNPPPNRCGRPSKSVARLDPPVVADFKGDTAACDTAKRLWFAKVMDLEGRTEVYSEAAYKRAFKRARRDPESDNRKRKERANYNIGVNEKRDLDYSRSDVVSPW